MTPVLDRVKHSKGCLACWTVVMRQSKNCRIMIYRASSLRISLNYGWSQRTFNSGSFLFHTCCLPQWFQFWQQGCSSSGMECREGRRAPNAHCTPQPWMIWEEQWRQWLRLKNLSVEKEVDKLRECGGLWIPTKILKSVSNTHKKEISWKSKKYETPKVTEYRNISQENFYRSWTKYVFIQKYLGSLETSVSLACLARKF